jgi:hypothetical protein
MTKNNILKFKNEFNHIDTCIESKKYRHAGYTCGYMLEYILLKIFKKLKSEADHELTIKLNELIKKVGGGIELDKFSLGELIQLINQQTPLKNNNSTKQKEKLLSLACHKLTHCKIEASINFSRLSEIRNQCAHPFKPDPSLKDIEKFKYTLQTLALEFKDIFDRENEYDKPETLPYFLFILTGILTVSALLISIYMIALTK